MTNRDTFPLGRALAITFAISFTGVAIGLFLVLAVGIDPIWWVDNIRPYIALAAPIMDPIGHVFLVWLGWLWRGRRCNGGCRA